MSVVHHQPRADSFARSLLNALGFGPAVESAKRDCLAAALGHTRAGANHADARAAGISKALRQYARRHGVRVDQISAMHRKHAGVAMLDHSRDRKRDRGVA